MMKKLMLVSVMACGLCSCGSLTPEQEARAAKLVDATPGVLEKLGKYNILNERDVVLGKEVLAVVEVTASK